MCNDPDNRSPRAALGTATLYAAARESIMSQQPRIALGIDELLQLVDAAPAETDTLPNIHLTGVNTLALAGPTQLCFAEHHGQVDAVRASDAGAVIVPVDFPSLAGAPLIRTDAPRQRFFQVAERFLPEAEYAIGIHPSAVVEPSADLGRDVTVGPQVAIAADARIGAGSTIGAGTVIGTDVKIGEQCAIGPNVTIQRGSVIGDRCILHAGTVIGGDGFGFDWDGTAHRKVSHLGRVVIEADVEIGCNSCIDRATLGETRIKRGTKIDNLVQIGHNTTIGEHVILVSQAGVAGSSSVGAGVLVAGQVAISDHVEIGAGARIGGQAGVTKDVAAGTAVFGTPARPMRETLRELAALSDLPALLKQIKRWAQRLTDLDERVATLERIDRADRR
jgi:UDP-3-O-[3-hydroxymyristoyl] glucosamine N-acyltransferase